VSQKQFRRKRGLITGPSGIRDSLPSPAVYRLPDGRRRFPAGVGHLPRYRRDRRFETVDVAQADVVLRIGQLDLGLAQRALDREPQVATDAHLLLDIAQKGPQFEHKRAVRKVRNTTNDCGHDNTSEFAFAQASSRSRTRSVSAPWAADAADDETGEHEAAPARRILARQAPGGRQGKHQEKRQRRIGPMRAARCRQCERLSRARHRLVMALPKAASFSRKKRTDLD
jgi:hypothetical protein